MFLEALNPKRSGSSLPTPNHPNHPLLHQQPLKALSVPGEVIASDTGHIASGGLPLLLATTKELVMKEFR